MSSLHPAVAELAKDCIDNRCHAAAAILRAGLTEHAAAVIADFSRAARHTDTRHAWEAQVAAWAAGRVDALAASQVAWGRHGCAACAVVALRAADAAARCAFCAENEAGV